MITWVKKKYSSLKDRFFRKKEIKKTIIPEIVQVEILNPANNKVVQYNVNPDSLGPKDFDKIVITETFVEFYLDGQIIRQYGKQYLYCAMFKKQK